jgi:hypothetical protein
VVGDLALLDQRFGVRRPVGQPPGVLADPLHQPGRRHPVGSVVGQVEQLVLQRRRAGVEHQDGDHSFSMFWA